MEERELAQLLQRVGDQVTPGPAPLTRIVAQGSALRRRRSGRVRVFAVAAAAAAVVGGGSVAAVVLDLPSLGGNDAAESAEGASSAGDGAGGGEAGGFESAPRAESGEDSGATDEGAAMADPDLVLPVTPDVVEPGATIELDVPDDVAFGLAWSLERRTGADWSHDFVLVDASDLAPGDPTPYWPVDEPRVVDSLLVTYTEPVSLVIPPDAAAGEYRICQLDPAVGEWCGSLTVTE